ncbi:MAG TPA: tRNA lysidine(34) synthetase TilS, partial [Verrucomicrobiota bacterium]|nr:tRNA lysidine(34) synthetase TilS [Verrucomicrobiota bacterium]
AGTCRRLGLPCLRGQAPAPGPHKGTSPEAAARARRLAFLADAARRLGAECVVTAHHADDQAELVMLRLLRGAGGEGLGGMTAADPFPGAPDLRLVRPFLGFSRDEIAGWAAAHGVCFREDETNADVRRPRNRLRHGLLPRLAADFQPALREVLARAAEITGAEADFVARAAADWLKSPGGAGFDGLHVAVQRAARLQRMKSDCWA